MATRQVRRKRQREKIEEMMRGRAMDDRIKNKMKTGLKRIKKKNPNKKIPKEPATKPVTQKPERVVSEKIVLDTNVILDSWKEIHVKGMHQLLKKSNIRILLTETTLGESTRKLKRDKKIVLEHLEKRFGNRLEPVRTTSEMINLAKKMEKKYPEKLHHPDSIIFAAAKIMEADLITNDQAVKECCADEKINAFDHRLVKIIEKKKKQPARQSTPKKTYYDKDGNKITAKEYRKLKDVLEESK